MFQRAKRAPSSSGDLGAAYRPTTGSEFVAATKLGQLAYLGVCSDRIRTTVVKEALTNFRPVTFYHLRVASNRTAQT